MSDYVLTIEPSGTVFWWKVELWQGWRGFKVLGDGSMPTEEEAKAMGEEIIAADKAHRAAIKRYYY